MIAVYIKKRSPVSDGAGVPRLEAAMIITQPGVEQLVRSAVTVTEDALIPAHGPPPLSVVAVVGVGGAVTRPHFPKH